MRISDWSSDVCSSDLVLHLRDRLQVLGPGLRRRADHGAAGSAGRAGGGAVRPARKTDPLPVTATLDMAGSPAVARPRPLRADAVLTGAAAWLRGLPWLLRPEERRCGEEGVSTGSTG